MPRERCKQCGRALSVCLCSHLVELQAPCEVVILQHPSEQKQALATVPILSLCLKPLQVISGEAFSDHPLIDTLLENPEQCRVLFPSDNSDVWQASSKDKKQEIKYLIVIDGTWRKARLIWHLNPWLNKLPCVKLNTDYKSQYQIRSTTVEGGLSTLEAVMLACECLDAKGNYRALLQPFNAMIDMQIERMGEQTFLSHYGKQD